MAYEAVPNELKNIKHIIAIASGKGGVGKSTVTRFLAHSLKEKNFKVGLLDADIYGPSQGKMLGVVRNPEIKTKDNKILPLVKDGIKYISMGVIGNPSTPVAWRSPLVIKMLQQFLTVEWGTLDFLLIDLPPGTGDIQLTLSQRAYLTGALIVTTPQNLAQEIAFKGLKMFQQVNVPILGIIENMSGFNCPHCDQHTDIFRQGGGKNLSDQLDIPLLANIPIDPNITVNLDNGILQSNKPFNDLTDALLQQLETGKHLNNFTEPTDIEITSEGNINFSWDKSLKSSHRAYDLRLDCPCAKCIDENSGEKIIDFSQIPLDIKITGINPIGRYGVSISYSDGHRTGIYKFSKLMESKNNSHQSFNV